MTPKVVPGPVTVNSGLYPSSPNGKRLLLIDDGKTAKGDCPFLRYVVLEGERAAPKPARGHRDTEAAAGWAPNNEEAYLYDRNSVPATVVLWNPLTGTRRPFLEIAPSDPTGVWGISNLVISDDGRAYAYSVIRKLSDLYLIEGLK